MHRSQSIQKTETYHHEHAMLASRLLLALLLTMALLLLCRVSAGTPPPKPTGITVENDLSTLNVRTEESNLADVIVDAIRAAGKTDIAFMPASAFKETTIPKGAANASDFSNCLMYPDDTVVIVKLTGTQIKQALERSLSLTPQKNSAFLQVSGLTMTVNPKGGTDNRVTSVKIAGMPMDNSKTYMVAMPSPLANGALAYFKVWSKSNIDHDTNIAVSSAIADYLASHPIISGKGDNKIVFQK